MIESMLAPAATDPEDGGGIRPPGSAPIVIDVWDPIRDGRRQYTAVVALAVPTP